MIRKAALQIGVPALLAFIAWNAYLAVTHLKRVQEYCGDSHLKAPPSKRNCLRSLKDVTDMETGQRGYLLTGDPAYLQPYTDAKDRIGTDFVQTSCGLSRIGRRANNYWSRSWSLWLNPSRLRWSVLLVCANKGIAVAHSSSSIQTKARTTWMRFVASRLRYPQRKAAISRDSTEREDMPY